MARSSPNIIISGTPGVGKTTHCELLAKNTGLKHLSINDLAKENDLYDGFDEETKSHILDEDKVIDHIDPLLEEGGYIIDYHGSDFFTERLIDLVVVIRCDSTILYDRLAARGYSGTKLEQNMDTEIMQELLEEARGAYAEEIVVELQSDEADAVEGNCERIEQWIETWKKNKKAEENENAQAK